MLPFLEVGRWSRVCGHTHSRSHDHVVSRQSHMYIESGLDYHNVITALTGETPGMSPIGCHIGQAMKGMSPDIQETCMVKPIPPQRLRGTLCMIGIGKR